ncbi:MAG TPA: DeoR family transcriptional regulator [Streptosporangiaceae bacterium]|nr:DeoR family transcriptional regulator [Streptosporangiaceae bacterium]
MLEQVQRSGGVRVSDLTQHFGVSDMTIRRDLDALARRGLVASLHLDMLFMGVHGADAKAGLTTPNLIEAETSRAFTESARHLVVLADHAMWGVIGLSQIVALSEVGTFVTDDGLDADARNVLASRVGDLIIASAGDRP